MPPLDASIAQLVEQRIENPRVGGSIPPRGTIEKVALISAAFLMLVSLRMRPATRWFDKIAGSNFGGPKGGPNGPRARMARAFRLELR